MNKAPPPGDGLAKGGVTQSWTRSCCARSSALGAAESVFETRGVSKESKVRGEMR